VGRPPELGEARSARLELRLHEIEREAIERAALNAGLATGEWARSVLLTAGGSTELLAQLRRVEGSPEQRLEMIRQRRLAEIVAGRRTPFYSLQGRGTPAKSMRFEHGVALHLAPRMVSWPPASLFALSGGEAIRESDRLSRDLCSRLLPHHGSPDVHSTTVIEDGYICPGAILATAELNGRGPPTGFSYLQRSGVLETVLSEHILPPAKLWPLLVADLRLILASQLEALQIIGAVAPIVMGISLFGVHDLEVVVRRGFEPYLPKRLHGDEHFLPLVTAPGWDVDARDMLRKPLDALWRVAGYESCPYLDDDISSKEKRS
jgi:hypothetical protein